MWIDRFRLWNTQQRPVSRMHEPILDEFTPRSSRFKLEIPTSFTVNESLHRGRCVNVSECGLLATFEELPELWAVGRLLLEAGDHYLSIHARVARIDRKEAGSAFLIETANDRAAISILIHSVSEHPDPAAAGPRL